MTPARNNTVQSEDDDPPRIVCNVCHLPYTGDECLVCKAEREHASSVIQERGRRHSWDKWSDPDKE